MDFYHWVSDCISRFQGASVFQVFILTSIDDIPFCVYTGTYSNIFREGDGDYSEPQIFHLPVWRCLQASYTRNRHILVGNNFALRWKWFSLCLFILCQSPVVVLGSILLALAYYFAFIFFSILHLFW